MLCPKKKFESGNIFGPICLPKNVGSKQILGPKVLWVQKNCGFESEKYFESKIFGPPPSLRQRVKLSGLDRERGAGMGVPSLGFNVAYIRILSLLQSLEPFEKGSKI